MPRMVTELPETYESISRPIAFDITRQVGEIMHLPAVTEILFNGATDQAMQAGSALNYAGAPTKFPGGSRIQVTMTESSDESNVLTENSLQENAPVCFLDRSLGLRLRPIYASTLLTLSFNVRSRMRNEAEKLRDEFRVRAAMGRQQILHTLIYHFGIPTEQMQLLQTIYEMRERVAGYGDTFGQWLAKHSTSRLTEVTNLVGQQAAYVFGETQVGVQGHFDFAVQPEAPDKQSDDGTYNYPIEYKIRYDKVIGMSVDYQLMNHNQLLPKMYYGPKIAGGIQPDPYATKLYSDTSNYVFRTLFLNAKLRPCPLDGVRYPVFDDWIPTAVTPETSTVYVGIVAVSPTDLYDVVDLTQLAGVVIDGDIRQYMASQGKNLGQQYLSAIHVGLYHNQNWMGDDAITVSSDLKVRTAKPLCLRDRYHIRLSVLNDLTRLTEPARLALRSQGTACQKILLTLQQSLPFGKYVPKLTGGHYVPDALLLQAAERINDHKTPHYNGLECRMLTVGNFLISAKRLDEYAPVPSGGPTGPAVNPSTDPRYEPLVPGRCERHGDQFCQCAH